MAEARSAGLLVILDVKRGDVGSTNEAYAQAFLGAGAPLEANADTVHPYLGLAAMDAFVSRAHQAGSCLLVVTHSSNPEGRAVQSARDGDGRQVNERLLGEIGELNRRVAPGQIGPVGAVVGQARIEPALDLAGAQALFLAPGVGAQGANPPGRGPGLRGLPGPGDAQRVQVAARRRSRHQGYARPGRRDGRRVQQASARGAARRRTHHLNDRLARAAATSTTMMARLASLAAWQSGHGAMQVSAGPQWGTARLRGVAAKVLHHTTWIWRRLPILTSCLTFC